MRLYLCGLFVLNMAASSLSCPPSCPPGTHCTSEKGYCVRCKARTFQDKETNSTQCIDCRHTCGQNKRMIKDCTSLTDTECQCYDGYFLDKYDTCAPHRECPPGHGVETAGNPANDTVCQVCGKDTFSANKSSIEPCLPCTRCSESEEVFKECTSIADRQCKVKDCGPLANPDHGSVDTASGTTYSKTASFSCNQSYYLSGPSVVKCESSGNWSDRAPQCVAVPVDNEFCGCVTAWIIAGVFLALVLVLVIVGVLLYLKLTGKCISRNRNDAEGQGGESTNNKNEHSSELVVLEQKLIDERFKSKHGEKKDIDEHKPFVVVEDDNSPSGPTKTTQESKDGAEHSSEIVVPEQKLIDKRFKSKHREKKDIDEHEPFVVVEDDNSPSGPIKTTQESKDGAEMDTQIKIKKSSSVIPVLDNKNY